MTFACVLPPRSRTRAPPFFIGRFGRIVTFAKLAPDFATIADERRRGWYGVAGHGLPGIRRRQREVLRRSCQAPGSRLVPGAQDGARGGVEWTDEGAARRSVPGHRQGVSLLRARRAQGLSYLSRRSILEGQVALQNARRRPHS